MPSPFDQLVHGSFGTILADPPWAFKVRSDKGRGRSAEAYYDTLSLDQIKDLPVADLAAKDCVLLMWVTDPFLANGEGERVIRSWGFEPKTVGFYWVKSDNWMGMGYWTRANPEVCLLATRGHPKPQAHDVRRLIVSPRRAHSQKPEETYNRIERLCAGPYIELFARGKREGWSSWGNETDSGPATRRWSSKGELAA
jgi:N6-adenosine-specific RNA methylase IME4